jgi:hypothetical protein
MVSFSDCCKLSVVKLDIDCFFDLQLLQKEKYLC